MALATSSLQAKITTHMKAQGFTVDGDHAYAAKMAAAIAAAVVEEITQNAQVTIGAGSSAGTYKVS